MRSPSHIVILLLFIHAVSLGQDLDKGKDRQEDDLIQFTGMVVTGDSLQPVPFTHIIDRNTRHGTISDYYGYFSFVAMKGDTVDFTSVGFKKSFYVIPDTIRGKLYTMFHVMTADTIYLAETVIYPWPSKEEFKEAFLSLELPDDDLEIARKNLDLMEMKARAEGIPMDGSMNYRNYIDRSVSKLYYAGQTQPITVLNPFAWAQFIKAWKEGKFKRDYNKP